MNNKKWYAQAQIKVIDLNAEDVIRTSGNEDDPEPTAQAVTGEAISWQNGWN